MPGKIITFYSYKGGTGRSLALANVAWILASQGQRVLCIDWDLEAPGLHRYFAPFLKDPQLAEKPGLIDWLFAYMQAATTAPTAVEPDPSPAADQPKWFEPYASVTRFAQPVQWSFADGGEIDFVGAGQQIASYAVRVQGINWDRFYSEFGGSGFLDACSARLRKDYDWVLIDSRTGISDSSGICTVQIPDAVALFFTLNNQSIEGVAGVARDMLSQRQSGGRGALQIYPCATRIELAEKHKLERRRRLVKERFAPLIEQSGTKLPAGYLDNMEVLYDPFYAYDEVLATVADTPGRANSVLAAMERLTKHLTDGKITALKGTSDSKRLEALRKFELAESNNGRESSTARPVAAATERGRYDVAIVVVRDQEVAARSLHKLLLTFCRPFFAPVDVVAGESISDAVSSAERSASVLVVLTSENTVDKDRARSHFEQATARGQRFVPVLLSEGFTPRRELFGVRAISAKPSDMQVVAAEVEKLLGLDAGPAAAEVATVDAWRERAEVAQRGAQAALLRTWIVAGVLVALGIGLAAYADGKIRSVIEDEQGQLRSANEQLKQVKTELAAAQQVQLRDKEWIERSDVRTLTDLEARVVSVENGVAEWTKGSETLSAAVAGLAEPDVAIRDLEAKIADVGNQLELSSSVGQSLDNTCAELKRQTDGLLISDYSAPSKAKLVTRLEGACEKLQSQGKSLEALSVRIQKISSQHVSSKREKAREQWRQGFAAFNRGSLGAAQKFYEEANRIDPKYAPAVNSLGLLASTNGDLKTAMIRYREAAKLDPKYAPAAGNIAALLLKQGELREAKDWATTALSANPDYAPARVSLDRIQQAQAQAQAAPF
jgi:Flp pilus assembly protein TadD